MKNKIYCDSCLSRLISFSSSFFGLSNRRCFFFFVFAFSTKLRFVRQNAANKKEIHFYCSATPSNSCSSVVHSLIRLRISHTLISFRLSSDEMANCRTEDHYQMNHQQLINGIWCLTVNFRRSFFSLSLSFVRSLAISFCPKLKKLKSNECVIPAKKATKTDHHQLCN